MSDRSNEEISIHLEKLIKNFVKRQRFVVLPRNSARKTRQIFEIQSKNKTKNKVKTNDRKQK